MTHRLTRRQVLGAAAAGLVVAACTRRDDAATDADDSPDVDFAAPWAELADDDLVRFGERARALDPGCLDHARRSLHDAGAGPRSALAAACDDDLARGALVEVDRWLVPRTLAGLAAALAAR